MIINKNQKESSPGFSDNEKQNWRWANIGGVCCILLGLLSLISFSGTKNLNGMGLFAFLFLLGLFIAYYISHRLAKKISIIRYQQWRTTSMVERGLLMLFACGLPAVFNACNKIATTSVCKNYIVLQKTAKTSTGGGPYLAYVNIHGRQEHIELSKAEWENVKVGTTRLEICIAKGRLGIYFITKVTAIK